MCCAYVWDSIQRNYLGNNTTILFEFQHFLFSATPFEAGVCLLGPSFCVSIQITGAASDSSFLLLQTLGIVVIAQVIVIRKIWLWPTSVPAILEVNQWMQVPTYHCFSFFLKKYLYCRSMIKPYLVKITMPKNPFLLSNKKMHQAEDLCIFVLICVTVWLVQMSHILLQWARMYEKKIFNAV